MTRLSSVLKIDTGWDSIFEDKFHYILTVGADKKYEVEIRDGFDAFRVSWYQQFGIPPEKLSSQTIPLTHWSYSIMMLKDLETGEIKFEEKSVSSPFVSV